MAGDRKLPVGSVCCGQLRHNSRVRDNPELSRVTIEFWRRVPSVAEQMAITELRGGFLPHVGVGDVC